MSARQQELMVVGGLVLGAVVLGYLQLGPKSSRLAADDAVGRGAMREAERAARECESGDAGAFDEDERLLCLARLAEIESGMGKVREARTRLDAALAEAARQGANVSSNTRSALFATSSLIQDGRSQESSIGDARRALEFATDLSHRAHANWRLGNALNRANEDLAEETLRTAHAQYLELEGPDGFNVATTGLDLGAALFEVKPDEAITLLEAAIATYAKAVDGGHPYGGIALGHLARIRVVDSDGGL